jgi:hypothetical protein
MWSAVTRNRESVEIRRFTTPNHRRDDTLKHTNLFLLSVLVSVYSVPGASRFLVFQSCFLNTYLRLLGREIGPSQGRYLNGTAHTQKESKKDSHPQPTCSNAIHAILLLPSADHIQLIIHSINTEIHISKPPCQPTVSCFTTYPVKSVRVTF